MSCLQANICCPSTGFLSASPSLSHSSYLRASHLNSFPVLKFRPRKACPRLVYGSPKYHRSPVCFLVSKGKSENDDEAVPWKGLDDAMGGTGKEPSLQDILRKQMKERKFGGAGGGGNPPGDGGDGSGGSKDGNFSGMLNELLQVVLATIGFIFVYIWVIRGEELTRLGHDCIKYLLGAKPSVRLERAIHFWVRFCQGFAGVFQGRRWWERTG